MPWTPRVAPLCKAINCRACAKADLTTALRAQRRAARCVEPHGRSCLNPWTPGPEPLPLPERLAPQSAEAYRATAQRAADAARRDAEAAAARVGQLVAERRAALEQLSAAEQALSVSRDTAGRLLEEGRALQAQVGGSLGQEAR